MTQSPATCSTANKKPTPARAERVSSSARQIIKEDSIFFDKDLPLPPHKKLSHSSSRAPRPRARRDKFPSTGNTAVSSYTPARHGLLTFCAFFKVRADGWKAANFFRRAWRVREGLWRGVVSMCVDGPLGAHRGAFVAAGGVSPRDARMSHRPAQRAQRRKGRAKEVRACAHWPHTSGSCIGNVGLDVPPP